MKFKVKYKQESERINEVPNDEVIYHFFRIIKYKRGKSLFYSKIKTLLYSTSNKSKENYCKKVDEMISTPTNKLEEIVLAQIIDIESKEPRYLNNRIKNISAKFNADEEFNDEYIE